MPVVNFLKTDSCVQCSNILELLVKTFNGKHDSIQIVNLSDKKNEWVISRYGVRSVPAVVLGNLDGGTFMPNFGMNPLDYIKAKQFVEG